MSADLSRKCCDIAKAAVVVAGRYVRQFASPAVETSQKEGPHDIVTVHDAHAEKLITDYIFQAHLDSTVVAEEGGVTGDGAVTWFVDPIDGTTNFAAGFPAYCVSVGAVHKGEAIAGAIYDPEADELFAGSIYGVSLNGRPVRSGAHARDRDSVVSTGFPYEGVQITARDVEVLSRLLHEFRAVRRIGSSALELAYVAVGRLDAAFELKACPWDTAAGLFLVRQAGGMFLSNGTHTLSPPHGEHGPWLHPRWVAVGRGFSAEESAISSILDMA